MKFSKLLVASAFFVFGAIAANAATVQTDNKRVDITCSGSCEVWLLRDGPNDGFDPNFGDWLAKDDYPVNPHGGNSNAARLTMANNILGTAFTGQSESSDGSLSVSIDEFTGGDDGSWTGSAEYYLAWGGSTPRYVLIKNNTANNMFSWVAFGGPIDCPEDLQQPQARRSDSCGNYAGAGLSGVDGFGRIPDVPLPAAGFLLLAGLGGLTVLRKKR